MTLAGVSLALRYKIATTSTTTTTPRPPQPPPAEAYNNNTNSISSFNVAQESVEKISLTIFKWVYCRGAWRKVENILCLKII